MSIDRRDLLHSLLRSAAGGVIVAIRLAGRSEPTNMRRAISPSSIPWLRSPGDGETTAPLFMIIENKGDTPDKLIGARAAKVGKIVIHADPARIVVPHGIVIPPRATVTLVPGGPHVGLHEVTKMNPVGWGFELTLIFEKAGEVTIDASVEAPDAKHAHDAEATERWEKATARRRKRSPRRTKSITAPMRITEHMHEEHEHMHEAHEHAAEEAPECRRHGPQQAQSRRAWPRAVAARASTDRQFRRGGSLSGRRRRAREGLRFFYAGRRADRVRDRLISAFSSC